MCSQVSLLWSRSQILLFTALFSIHICLAVTKNLASVHTFCILAPRKSWLIVVLLPGEPRTTWTSWEFTAFFESHHFVDYIDRPRSYQTLVMGVRLCPQKYTRAALLPMIVEFPLSPPWSRTRWWNSLLGPWRSGLRIICLLPAAGGLFAINESCPSRCPRCVEVPSLVNHRSFQHIILKRTRGRVAKVKHVYKEDSTTYRTPDMCCIDRQIWLLWSTGPAFQTALDAHSYCLTCCLGYYNIYRQLWGTRNPTGENGLFVLKELIREIFISMYRPIYSNHGWRSQEQLYKKSAGLCSACMNVFLVLTVQ